MKGAVQLNFAPYKLNKKGTLMNKAELIAKSATDAGITKEQAKIALDSITNSISETLVNDGKVTLIGFGTFSVSNRAARTGRNPQTGADIQIKASKNGKFKAGKSLKEKLNA
jgi:DNA-binding protein HU-beta